jgi:tetratricopeptide (TPR) repeat protein
MSAGQLGEAERILRQSLTQHPQHPDLLHLMGLVAHAAGRNDVAIRFFQQAITLTPDQSTFRFNLAVALLALGNYQAAREELNICLQLKPGWVDALNALGALLRRLKELEEGERVLRRAMKKAPKRLDVAFNLARLLADSGRYQDSEPLFKRVVDGQKNNAVAWDYLGVARYAMGRFSQAETAYRKAISLNPNCGRFHRHLGQMKKVDHADDPDLLAAVHAVQSDSLTSDDRLELNFSLAKMYDELGNYERAFDHARRANEIHRHNHQFDPDEFESETRAIIQYFNKGYFRRLNYQSVENRPVFIVGMPRSGTTLLEQMLCRHPMVSSAGELSWIQQLPVRHPAWPLPQEVLEKERRDYLRTLTVGQGKSKRIIDKMPMNFRHLGLIATLFPDARVIHMQRQPLQTCRSNYFAYFATGNFFTNDLVDLGTYYGEYLRIMQHWRSVRPLAMHELKYEDLVTRPKDCLTRLLEFLDLPWEDACLSHHEGDKTVMTASAWQVRQPVYKSSLDRAEPYGRYFAPTMARIAAVEAEMAEAR